MKVLVIASFLLASIGIGSCKKGYTCACSTESGFYDGFDIHDSKKRAEKKCSDYERTQYDTAFISNVKCELKKGE